MILFHFMIVFVIIILTVWLVCRILSRRRWAPPTIRPNLRIVVGQMAMIASQNLPLSTGLMLASESEWGKTGKTLRRIAKLLAEGLDVHAALERGYPQCPGIVVSVIRAGERAGRLPASLQMLDQHLTEQYRRRKRLMPASIPYAVVLFTFFIFVWMGIMVAVVPKFEQIFADFGTRLPGLTQLLIKITTWFVQGDGPFFLIGLSLLAIMLVYCRLRPRRPDRPRLTSRIADAIRWRMPGLGRLTQAQDLGMIVSLFRLFTRAGMTLDRAARLAAEADVNLILRHRVERFADLVATGTVPAQAATQVKLGNVFAIALRSGQFGNQLDTALQFATDYYNNLTSRLWIVLRNLSWPIVVLSLAVLIGTAVVALFLPLVTLINAVTGQV